MKEYPFKKIKKFLDEIYYLSINYKLHELEKKIWNETQTIIEEINTAEPLRRSQQMSDETKTKTEVLDEYVLKRLSIIENEITNIKFSINSLIKTVGILHNSNQIHHGVYR
jgi:ferritin-like metal-binding protein YciE